MDDPALARYDIIVRIDDRVAELSGSVPSMEIALKAETSLRSLLGLASIRNRLTIEDKVASGRNLNEQSPDRLAHAGIDVAAFSDATRENGIWRWPDRDS